MKISNLPMSIPALDIHFAAAGKSWNVPVGPMMWPRPGPTFEMEVTAADIAVRKSSPTNDNAIASSANERAYKNRKLMTDSGTSAGSGFPL